MAAKTGRFKFRAEVSQLLDILVHSLYTNRDIFLRELVSNASDALDKFRFESARNADLDTGDDLKITISMDKDAGTLTVTDTGVGMTKEELVDNIGTIAHSGSAEFIKKAAEGKEGLDGLIGRFGVGFYSVYMAADTVTLKTRSFQKDAQALEWTSDGRSGFTIREMDEDLPRGTAITVHLKEDMIDRFTDPGAIKSIIKKHSNFISFPIEVDGERVNTVSALWREPKFNVKQEEYDEFYKFLTYDTEGPMETIHLSVDAPVQFSSLLFVPKKEWDVFGMNRDDWGPDLYVRRVLIQHQNKDLLPQYLSFCKGVVDTEDLPLNISRETLQENLLLKKISSTLVKNILGHLEKMAENEPEKYEQFWREHGKTFKVGYGDYANRERFASLVRFNSSDSEDDKGLASLDQYISRAKEGQKEIYYVYGVSREAANLNPHLEIFRQKGLEVFYLFEPIDEFVMDSIHTYKEFTLKSAEHADLSKIEGFTDVEGEDGPEPLDGEQAEQFGGLLARMKEILGDRVTEVVSSERLKNSPVCLVNPDGGVTSSMDRIMRVINKDASVPKKVLEVNPGHPLCRDLLAIFAKNPGDDFISLAVEQLFESALLLEGYLNDPHALVGRMQDLLGRAGRMYAEKQAKTPPHKPGKWTRMFF